MKIGDGGGGGGSVRRECDKVLSHSRKPQSLWVWQESSAPVAPCEPLHCVCVRASRCWLWENNRPSPPPETSWKLHNCSCVCPRLVYATKTLFSFFSFLLSCHTKMENLCCTSVIPTRLRSSSVPVCSLSLSPGTLHTPSLHSSLPHLAPVDKLIKSKSIFI